MTRVLKREELDDGDYYVVCDRTGFRVPASKTRMTWDGLRVWDEVWEPRHPQDFVRGVPDRQTVPNPRPKEAEPAFRTTPVLPEDL
jgi:hypothetical protein